MVADILSQQIGSLVLCLPVIIYGAYLLYETLRIRVWRPVAGKILHFDQKMTRYGGQAYITYSYEVNGRAFRGTRISLSDGLIAQGAWQVHRLRKKFQPGTFVNLFYDPLCPEKSVLLRPSYAWSIGCLILGIGSAVCLIVLASNDGPKRPITPPSF